jgi:hypothetical protein
MGEGHGQGDYDAAYNRWSQWADINNGLYIAFGLAYTYNLIDTLWNAKRPGERASRALPMTIALQPHGLRVDMDVVRF